MVFVLPKVDADGIDCRVSMDNRSHIAIHGRNTQPQDACWYLKMTNPSLPVLLLERILCLHTISSGLFYFLLHLHIDLLHILHTRCEVPASKRKLLCCEVVSVSTPWHLLPDTSIPSNLELCALILDSSLNRVASKFSICCLLLRSSAGTACLGQ